jgi:pimeloyl-ACP methyl ester carboxylesterase
MNETDGTVSSPEDRISRRDLMRGAAAVTAAATFLPGAAAQSSAQTAPLDIAEYSWSWVGVERVKLARGTVANGEHMYVEYQIPRQVKHPYPVVLVHGGNGQGIDWMGTPDGRRGWASYFLEAGYKVYIVDRPGQGRPVYHPALFGNFNKEAPTFESVERNITAIAKQNPAANPSARLHSQWPGSGETGDPALDQFVASLGPAVPDPGAPFNAGAARIHEIWRSRSALLLDEIGPAILMTHGDSSPFAWLAADERPNLVKGIVAIEPSGPAFGPLSWGITASRITYDPPAATAEEIRTAAASAEPGAMPYRLQATPSRRLQNLAGIPIAVVTAEASAGNLRDPGTVAFLRQAGCAVDHVRLAEQGVRGNGHYMMLEKNNREALQPILGWMERLPAANTAAIPSASPSAADSTAVKLADQGCFWTGVERKKMPYGTIATGQMYVQYFVPAEVRYPHPIVLIHGGGGQATHMMGVGRRPGWLHYFIQEGYRVYLVDRPAWGRSPFHPDAFDLSHLGLFSTYERLNVFRTPQWPGPTGQIGDPLVDQFIPNEIGAPPEEAIDSTLFVNAGAALLDKIGPAILLTHAFSGSLGWALADRRPALVKGIVAVEANGVPFGGQLQWGLTSVPVAWDPPVSNVAQLSLVDVRPAPAAPGVPPHKLQNGNVRRLRNLRGIPIAWVTGELRGASPNGNNGPAQVAFLRQAGCAADHVQLKDHGILGNGNLMLIEKNNKEVFTVIGDWLARSVAAPSAPKA